MIIETLLNAILNLFYTVLNFINIPQIPSDVLTSVNSTIDTIITRGEQLIELVMPYNVAKVLIGIVIGIEVGIEVYHFIMWVLKKIPMLGIE